MKDNMPKFNIIKRIQMYHVFILTIVLMLLIYIPHRVEAITNTGPATPSSTSYANHAPTYFQNMTPPIGVWTSTTTPLAEGNGGSYLVPQITTPCSLSRITSINISILDTTIDLAPGTSQDLSGVFAEVVATTDNSMTPLDVDTVTSGTGFTIPWGGDNKVVRGLTNDLFTLADAPIPGSIEFSLNTSSMNVAAYNNLAINVYHDLLDAQNGFVNSVSTSQPIVSVITDDTPCFIKANNDTYDTTVNQTLVISPDMGVRSNDTPQESTVAIHNQPTHGSITLNPDGSFTYIPNPGYVGQDLFSYILTDTHGNTSTATVTISVNNVPAAPNAGTLISENFIFISIFIVLSALILFKLCKISNKYRLRT